MNFVRVGIAKFSVNSYVTTKIGFANMLARLCERVPGVIVDAGCIGASPGGAAH
jgi:UDPglucose 6-dehydrogenase